MFQRGWFLIEAEDAEVAATAREVVQLYGVARAWHAATRESCEALLAERGRVAGLIVELTDRPIARLQELRELAPSTPILALAHAADAALVNASQHANIELAIVPVQLPSLVSFVQRALSASFLPHAGVARALADLARARRLTPREVQILTYCLGNEPRARVRRRLGVAENTLKTQVRSLLRKCEARSVDALAKNLLRAALLTGRVQQEAVFPWPLEPAPTGAQEVFAESA